ncbi:MAG: hypothetical protein GY832_15440 [Chloroflexi bacterium]|nr:hypothetical protein [Chloroflexota bacterium]
MLRFKVWCRDRWVGACRFLLAVMDFDFRTWLEEQANSDEWAENRYSRLY